MGRGSDGGVWRGEDGGFGGVLMRRWRRRVMESGVVDLIDRNTGNVFGVRRKRSPKKFLAAVVVAGGKGLLGPRGGRCGGNDGRGGSIAGRGEGRFSKRSIDLNDGRGGGGLPVLGGRSSRESKSACREVGRVEKISSTGSKLMVRGEECLEGCVSASGGEVNGGGDDFGMSKVYLVIFSGL
nr:hypothetical protein [Tanacetum cinerariifolium]